MQVDCPALVVMARQDRLVPLATARPLAQMLPDAEELSVPTGHVGLMVSQHAPEKIWQPIHDWVNARLRLPSGC
jgi:poly(3-hydroxyalkanoate) synthetase